MCLQLNPQKLEVYRASKEFVLECYRLSRSLPDTEKSGMIVQIKRSALSVHPNIAEGCSRKSDTERKRYYEIARGSFLEIDAALHIANELAYVNKIDMAKWGENMVRCFKLLSGMMN